MAVGGSADAGGGIGCKGRRLNVMIIGGNLRYSDISGGFANDDEVCAV